MDIEDAPEPKAKKGKGQAKPKEKSKPGKNRQTGEDTKELQKDIKACLDFMCMIYQLKVF